MTTSASDMVRLTIDGTPMTVPKGTLVIEAARRVGVMIPHFCYHPKLKPDANCRMCLVEIEKMPKLQTSCSTPVAEGMAVRTATTVVNDAHKSVLEFILANHPLDCPVCDQGGSAICRTFPMSTRPPPAGSSKSSASFQKEYFSPLIETQMNRCVQCLRCVRYCDEVMDVKALAPVGRGTMTEIKHFGPHQLGLRILRGLRPDLPGRRHYQPAFHVRVSSVDAETRRYDLYLLRRRLPDHVQTKDNELIEVNSLMEPGATMAICARADFLASMSRPIRTG